MDCPTWQAATEQVLRLPMHEAVELDHQAARHPRQAGFRRSIGLDLRARGHYRRRLPDGRGLHVLEFRDHYRIHWDATHPSTGLLRHFTEDVTHAVRRAWRGERRPPTPLDGPGRP